MKIAKGTGWPEGRAPRAASGLRVVAFATQLDHPRNVYALPNGDVLVAETNAPPRPDDAKGIKGWFFKRFQKKGGGAVPSANRITLLRDADGDGVAEVRSSFATGLTSPFGMTLVDSTLYVANTDAVLAFRYRAGDTAVSGRGSIVSRLPAGTRNHHWTKTIVASPDARTLYVSIGSNSNVAEHGLDAERDRAVIWAIDRVRGTHRVFASGLRNAAGLTIEPMTGVLWAAVNERDELGSDLVPDYMTSVRDGAFYGWPFSYFGQHVDTRVAPQDTALVRQAVTPDYALGAHTASIGLAPSSRARLPARFCTGMFIGQHGSWNRKPPAGYRVIFVPFAAGRPVGEPEEVLTEFLQGDEAYGRPVGVAIDSGGALLVADDVGNTVWRVTAATASTPRCESR
jgi:glucose/arabinose dehydrogenase